MQKLLNILISTRTTAVLFLVYIIAMATATFVENEYGTPTAKIIFYNARWFEFLQLLLILNFIGNIKRYRLFRKEKFPLLLFHLAFVVIFIGGAISRYSGFEGIMSIREGQVQNIIKTDKNYFRFKIDDNKNPAEYKEKPFEVAEMPKILTPFFGNFKSNYSFNDEKISIEKIGFIPRAIDTFIKNNKGKNYLQLVTTGENGRENHYLEEGEMIILGGVYVGLNVQNPIPNMIQIIGKDDSLKINSPIAGNYMVMATQQQGAINANAFETLKRRSLYSIGSLQFVMPETIQKGNIKYLKGDKQKDKNLNDIAIFEIRNQKNKKTVAVRGGKGVTTNQIVTFENKNISMGFGAKILTTNFAIKLNKFELENYPGSNSPSSFASEVAVIDDGKENNYRIFMNNVLDYKGYRFFQASYDSDKKGTILSVNHDFWGTLITYTGYTFLFLGLFLVLFWKGTRFWSLASQLKSFSNKKLQSIVFILFLGLLNLHAQQHDTSKAYQIIDSLKFNQENTDAFGALQVQTFDGRIQPTNTLALDLIKKITHKRSFRNLDANQWLLSLQILPSMLWTQIPMIYVSDKGGEELQKLTKANDQNYAKLTDLFFPDKNKSFVYVLEEPYNLAFSKKPADRTQFDKEIINVNERVQIFQSILSGIYLRNIPIPNEPQNTWTSGINNQFEIVDSTAFNLLGKYKDEVLLASVGANNWTLANSELQKIKRYQQKWGKKILLSDEKVKWELRYNKVDIFFYLMIAYSMLGAFLLILAFTTLFYTHKVLDVLKKTGMLFLYILLFIHAVGLAIRWYISGHAPWSNGYEAVIFIAWIGLVSSFILNSNYNKKSIKIPLLVVSITIPILFIFAKLDIIPFIFLLICIYILTHSLQDWINLAKNKRDINLFVAVAGCLTAVIMMGFAHGGASLNPQITPLVPVLKSYWLMVHVAIITSSYGFFGLSALIGLIVLYLFVFQNNTNQLKIKDTIKELYIINEMSLTVGIFLLTVGTFLGGIWANESWGRYWSWDPKETWAYISIIVYAFVLHMRLVPGLRGVFAFSLMSIWAFFSIIMTYFGVNYYLNGLHSYATGDPLPIPTWLYVTVILLFISSIVSYFYYKKNKKLIN